MLRSTLGISLAAACAVSPLLFLAGCAEHAEYVAEPVAPAAVVAEPVVEAEPVEVVAPAPVAAPVVWAAAPPLAAVADAHAHAAMPNGVRLGNAVSGVAYARKDFTDWMYPLEAGHCYAFGFAADATVRKLQVSLFSPEHRRLDRERGLPPQGTMRHCAAESGMYRLEARAGGAGNLVVVAYADPPPGQAVRVAAPVAGPAAYAPMAAGPVVVSQAGSTVNVYTR